MNMIKKRKSDRVRLCVAVVAAISVILGLSASARADIIIYDDFNRTGALNGSTVDIGAQNWVSAAGGHNNTTSGDGGQEIGGWNAGLSFTPSAGNIYQLTLTAGPTIENALQVAFGNHSGGFDNYNYLSQDVANMAYARIGSVDGGVYDYGNRVANVNDTKGTYALDANTGPGYVNKLDLLLDTTSGLATSQLTWKINGVTKGTWTADVSTYNSIMFGRGTGTQDPNNTQISDLTLQTIPEPTSGLMLIAGAVGLGLLRRKLRG